MAVHDSIIDDLEERIKVFDYKGKNEEYRLRNRVVGEVDFYFVRDNTLFGFEIKSNFKKKYYEKALVQLDRLARKHYLLLGHGVGRVQKYFVTWEREALVVKYVGSKVF